MSYKMVLARAACIINIFIGKKKESLLKVVHEWFFETSDVFTIKI